MTEYMHRAQNEVGLRHHISEEKNSPIPPEHVAGAETPRQEHSWCVGSLSQSDGCGSGEKNQQNQDTFFRWSHWDLLIDYICGYEIKHEVHSIIQ